jgi:hypothetical protein
MNPDVAFIHALQTRFSGSTPEPRVWGQDQKYPTTLPPHALVRSQDSILVVIEDHQGCSTWMDPATSSTGSSGLQLENPTGKLIYLLKIDKAWFLDHQHSQRCDCVIFDDQTFCFVELKLQVSTWKRASERIKEAIDQIKNTLTFFRLHMLGCQLSRFQLEAYIVMQSHIYPRQPAGRTQRQVRFLEETGLKLYEHNHKTFA